MKVSVLLTSNFTLAGLKTCPSAASVAVRQWEYTPTLLDGESVEVVRSVSVVFAPDGEPPAASAFATSAPAGTLEMVKKAEARNGPGAPSRAARHDVFAMPVSRYTRSVLELPLVRFAVAANRSVTEER